MYSGIFVLHVQCHASRNEIDNKKQRIIFYALCVLYVLSVTLIALDTVSFVVSNNAAFFDNFALISCVHRPMTSV